MLHRTGELINDEAGRTWGMGAHVPVYLAGTGGMPAERNFTEW